MKEKNVLDFYFLCNRLKNEIRTGWKNWNVSKERLESVAEHIYGTQMLAIAMYSEFNYDLDITKVVFMLAIHELGETVIGDLTMFQITKEEKEKIEHDAVKNILKDLNIGKDIEELFLEFDEHKTKESIFAYSCDKLECDIQSRVYDNGNYVDLNKQEGNDTMNDPLVKELLEKGYSFSDMWLMFSQKKYMYDENFLKVSNYLIKNK